MRGWCDDRGSATSGGGCAHHPGHGADHLGAEHRMSPEPLRVAVEPMKDPLLARLTIGQLSWVITRESAQRIADMLSGTARKGTSGWTVVDVYPR
jgi:hypothetical protein